MAKYILKDAVIPTEVVKMKMVRILKKEHEHFDVLDENSEELMDEDKITPEEAGFLMGWDEAY